MTAEFKSTSTMITAENKTRSPLFVGSVEKGFAILHAFTHTNKPLSLTDIVQKTGLDKSAAQRFCYTLVELGFLVRDQDSRRMTPSARMLEFSAMFLASDPISSIAAPYLLQAREASGQAVNLALPMEQDVIYIARLASSTSQLVNPLVGARVPMYCTSSGRAFMSTLTDKEINIILDLSDFRLITRNTITDRSEILRRVEEVRAKGYTISHQECINGEVTIGAPIWGRGQIGVGAMNICVAKSRWPDDRIKVELVPLLCECAHDISVALAN